MFRTCCGQSPARRRASFSGFLAQAVVVVLELIIIFAVIAVVFDEITLAIVIIPFRHIIAGGRAHRRRITFGKAPILFLHIGRPKRKAPRFIKLAAALEIDIAPRSIHVGVAVPVRFSYFCKIVIDVKVQFPHLARQHTAVQSLFPTAQPSADITAGFLFFLMMILMTPPIALLP